MLPSIYGRPLWPYGRLGLALGRSTSPPPLERYVRQRGDGWNILEKRRCVEVKITCPHPSQTWTMFPSIYGRPLWPYGRLGLALYRSTSPPPLERYVRQRGDGWNILEKRRCVEVKITCPHPSQTWTMLPSIYGRPLWPYGRLGLALD